jgi:Fe-S-cluster containining protein
MARGPVPAGPEAGRSGGAGPWGPPPAFQAPSVAEAAALRRIYARVDEALAGRSATCQACGRCCAFRPGGPVLFASALEMAFLVTEAGPPGADGRVPPGEGDDAWRCLYQAPQNDASVGGLCAAREARPLGCRTYFCDPAAREAGERLHADALGQIREVGGPGAEWYGPARDYLAALAV